MTESKKEQEAREELSTEMADEVSGGRKVIKRNDGGRPYCPEKAKPAVVEPAPSSGPAPAPAAPGGSTHTKTDNIDNTNNGGVQKIGNQGRNNRIDGTVNF